VQSFLRRHRIAAKLKQAVESFKVDHLVPPRSSGASRGGETRRDSRFLNIPTFWAIDIADIDFDDQTDVASQVERISATQHTVYKNAEHAEVPRNRSDRLFSSVRTTVLAFSISSTVHTAP
jgi:hypothetical protein